MCATSWGTVVRVAPAVGPATMLGLVRVALAASEGVKVGTAATGQIAIRQRPGIRVPASALRRSTVGEDEVVVCEGGTAHVRTVAIGQRGEQGTEIKDGLKPGEQVVVASACSRGRVIWASTRSGDSWPAFATTITRGNCISG